MLFNSLSFLLFFPIVVTIYFALPTRQWRVFFLLAASYFFYMSWKVEYILLIVSSTLIDYWVGRRLKSTPQIGKRKLYLAISLVFNLGLLLVFKYLNFFLESFNTVFSLIQLSYRFSPVELILPVGISFYTFQTLSYSIDVYRGKKTAETNLSVFALYVSFFPQLVAGPIERATTLLPQFHIKHLFREERVVSGLQLMMWGFFKKVVIADRLAMIVNQIYSAPENFAGINLLIATYFFAFQIYCDFSGYSDIAIGAARILGFDLMQNFNKPYFSMSVPEFWRRWHISLSTWFRDYLYIPLGGNRVTKARWYFNLMIVFLISGLWHGANWTFVIWGALHGLYVVVSSFSNRFWEDFEQAIKSNRIKQIYKLTRVFVTFHLVLIAWIFFRANTLSDALYILRHIFDWSHLNIEINSGLLIMGLFLITLLQLVQIWQGNETIPDKLSRMPVIMRWSLYYLVLFAILFLGVYSNDVQFIYFQF